MLRKKGTMTAVVLVAAVVLAWSVAADARAAEASPAPGAPAENPNVNKALATGRFDCSIQVVDPPGDTGTPTGSATIGIQDLLGVVSTGQINTLADLGSGDGLDPICQGLAEQFLSRSRALGCTTGPIRTIEFTGGNFTQKTRSFDFVCVNSESRVLETIGALLGDMITIPSAAQVIKRSDLERCEPAAPGEARPPLQASPRTARPW
jgi:hypothetical protein